MAPLASTTDLEGRLGRPLTAAELARAPALLGDASALVRGYTRQTFESVADDTIVTRPVGTVIRLPQRPVTEVSGVVALSGVDAIPDYALPAGMWTWDGIDKVNVLPFSRDPWVELPEVWLDLFAENVNTYRLTYSHGYDPIPDAVVAVVAGMVNRVLLAPSDTEGMVSERIGQYFYQMQQGMGSTGASVRMTQADKDALAPFRRSSTTIQVVST